MNLEQLDSHVNLNCIISDRPICRGPDLFSGTYHDVRCRVGPNIGHSANHFNISTNTNLGQSQNNMDIADTSFELSARPSHLISKGIESFDKCCRSDISIQIEELLREGNDSPDTGIEDFNPSEGVKMNELLSQKI